MRPAIRVENLSKCYRVSDKKRSGQNLSETVTATLRAAWGKVRQLADPNATQADTHEFWALKDVTFEVQPGEVVGIIGRNGAGKSTLLKILSQIVEPTGGRAEIDGRVGSLLEVGTGFHPELTGRENVYLNGAILGMSRKEIGRKFDDIVAFAEVDQFLDTPVKRYSSGMYVRLAFAVAAHLDPEILLVDEVLAVGDVEFQKKCIHHIRMLARSGKTILFVSHHIASVNALCSSAVLIANGAIEYSGNTADAIHHYSTALAKNATVGLVPKSSSNAADVPFAVTSVYFENEAGEPVLSVASGTKFSLCFDVRSDTKVKDVDIGFSVHDSTGDMICLLYSSYTQDLFSIDSGSATVRCRVNELQLDSGVYLIHIRVVQRTKEIFYPRDPVAQLNVSEADFYGSGVLCREGKPKFLIRGNWTQS